MNAYHLLFIVLVTLGLLTGCAGLMNAGDPDAYFRDQMAAFEHPALIPDDQMPYEYDTSFSHYQYGHPHQNDAYKYQGSVYPIYQQGSDSAYAYTGTQKSNAQSPRHSTLSGTGGGAEEVPFMDTRKKRTTAPPS